MNPSSRAGVGHPCARIVVVAALATAFSASAARTQEGSGGFVVETDSTADFPWTPGQMRSFLPERGRFTFPAPYGNEGIRVTNASDCGGSDCVEPLRDITGRNIDAHRGRASMLVLLGLRGPGPTLFRIDKGTGHAENLGPLFDADSPFASASVAEWYFSARRPGVLYLTRGALLLRYDVLARTFETVFDAATEFGDDREIVAAHSSDGDDVHSALLRDAATGAPLGCLAYREDTRRFSFHPAERTVDCLVDEGGRWLVVQERADGGTGVDTRLVDLDTGGDTLISDVGALGLGSAPTGAPLSRRYTCGEAEATASSAASEIACSPVDGSGLRVLTQSMRHVAVEGHTREEWPGGNLDVTGRYFLWVGHTGDRRDAFIVKVPTDALIEDHPAAADSLPDHAFSAGSPTAPPPTPVLAAPSGAVPDPLLLPVATTAQVPLTAAYNALNVPSRAAGSFYLDPTTAVKIYKLTSATFPTASANWGHDYSEGGDEVSLPYNGETRSVLVRRNGGSWFLVDFTPGVGVGNGRALAGNLAPFMDLAFTFSNNPATPYYAYVSNGSTIRRVDMRTMAEAPGGGWPVTGETSAMWLHQSENDSFFTWMRGSGGSTIVGYEPTTSTKKTYTNSGLNEPRIDRAGRYVGVCMTSPYNGLVVWDWLTNSVLWTTPGDPGIPFAHNASLRRRWMSVDWNMSYPPEYTKFSSDVPNSAVRIGGPATGSTIYGNGNWIQHPANLDDQWAAFSYYGGLRPPESYWLAPGATVLITANGQRRILMHPYNTISNYLFHPFAKFSPDGKYVLFTSNMNGSGRSDLFLAELPQAGGPPDTTPPAVSITAPANGATVSGAAVPVSASASDNVGVVGVQFKLDGVNLGAEDTTPPYGVSWNTLLSANGSHSLTAIARDAAGNSGTSAPIGVTVNNPPPDTTPPAVSITAPAAGSTVSGSPVAVSADASDNVGVSGVQFKLDGANLGAEDTTAPYGIFWNTFLTSNGPHTLTAVARDAAGNSTTSLPVNVTVNNVDVVPPVISSVSASNVSTTGATVTWVTNEPADSQVEYGTTAAYGSSTVLAPALVLAHSQALSGLVPATLYHYRVRSRDAAGNLSLSPDSTFTTLSVGAELIAHWKMDEGSGVIAADSSGNGHTGSLVGGATWTPGRIGQAVRLDGIDDHVSAAHSADENAFPLTVSAWFQTSTTSGARAVVNKYRAASFDGYQIFFNNGRLCAWYLRNSSNNVYDGTTCLFSVPGYNDGLWHQAVFVVDASGGTFYVDGTEKGQRAWTGTAGPVTSIEPVHLGHYPGATAGTEYLPGAVDDVRLYSRALTAAEVAQLYAQAPPPDTNPPVISAVAATGISGTTATITWTTDEPSDSQVEYGPTAAYKSATAVDPAQVTAHVRGVTGLAPSTLYHYRVKSRDAAGNLAVSADFTFTTAAVGPSTGPVAYWKLDDGSGVLALDSSGNGHTGTLVNGPTWIPGRAGQGLALDGVDDYVSVPHAAGLNAFPLTVAVWFRTTSSSGTRGLVSKYVASSFNGYQIFFDTGALCAWFLRDTSNYVFNGRRCSMRTPGYNDGQWHHAALVVDAAGGKLYVDAIQKASQPWTGAAGAPSTTQELRIGHYVGVSGSYLPGLVDDIQVHNRALTAAEIAALYSAVPAGVDGGPI